MATYVLTWNPKYWPKTDVEVREFSDAVAGTKVGSLPILDWNTGDSRSVDLGDRVFLLRQGKLRGMVGSGYVSRASYLKPHGFVREQSPESPTIDRNTVDVRWEYLLDEHDILAIEVLKQRCSDIPWDYLRKSGRKLSEDSATRLEGLWRHHLKQIGLSPGSTDQNQPEVLANELPNGRSYPEGACHQILVNAFERSESARKACVEHFGVDCAVCGFNFESVYGPLGNGYIHVHHLRDLATIKSTYTVDPIHDLRPVCPNCHAMLHRTTPAMQIETLKELMRKLE
jgi:5-methylcytosine-specific restriction enzyme A